MCETPDSDLASDFFEATHYSVCHRRCYISGLTNSILKLYHVDCTYMRCNSVSGVLVVTFLLKFLMTSHADIYVHVIINQCIFKLVNNASSKISLMQLSSSLLHA